MFPVSYTSTMNSTLASRRRLSCKTEKMGKPECSRPGSDSMEVLGDGEVGALGLLIFQAAKTGSAAGLRFALSRKNGEIPSLLRDSRATILQSSS